MRVNRFLALTAVFTTLFAGCGRLFAQDATNFKQLTMMKGHHKPVTSVSCSPDGKYVLSGSADSTLIIWNPKSGARLNPLKGHNSFVECVSWSPDGTRFASGSLNGGVIVWDANSNARVHTLKGHTFGVESICWSPDGKYLASGASDETIVIWDANSGAKLKTLEGHEKTVTSVSWSPDGKYLASAAWDMSIVLWNPNNGRNLQTLKGHTFSVESLCWTPDGKYLISGAGDQTVRIWSEETEYIYREVPLPDRKPERNVVKEDSKPENGVETDQAQIEEPAKMIIKKSIEKTEEEILIKEYDQQGKLIKMTKIGCPDCKAREFNFKDGKIISATKFDGLCSLLSIDKNKNTVTYDCNASVVIEFTEFGIKKITETTFEEGTFVTSYEYNENGLLIKRVSKDWKGTITYTYDVMSQDWTKRTGTNDQGNKTITTRTLEYW